MFDRLPSELIIGGKPVIFFEAKVEHGFSGLLVHHLVSSWRQAVVVAFPEGRGRRAGIVPSGGRRGARNDAREGGPMESSVRDKRAKRW
jgi:hypothetical protein